MGTESPPDRQLPVIIALPVREEKGRMPAASSGGVAPKDLAREKDSDRGIPAKSPNGRIAINRMPMNRFAMAIALPTERIPACR